MGSNQLAQHCMLYLPLFLLGMCKAHLQREGSDKSCSETTTNKTFLKFAQTSVSNTSVPSSVVHHSYLAEHSLGNNPFVINFSEQGL